LIVNDKDAQLIIGFNLSKEMIGKYVPMAKIKNMLSVRLEKEWVELNVSGV
jgi:hypothetical protein